MLERLNKAQARKKFLENESICMVACKEMEKIYMVACNVRIPNQWVQPYEMMVARGEKKTAELFDSIVNNFEYYNCNNELGRYTTFYMEL